VRFSGVQNALKPEKSLDKIRIGNKKIACELTKIKEK